MIEPVPAEHRRDCRHDEGRGEMGQGLKLTEMVRAQRSEPMLPSADRWRYVPLLGDT